MRRFALQMTTFAGAVAIALTLGASPVAAQAFKGRGNGRGTDGVPPGHRPPPGMCRIWIDGVPPGQQPAPTDCATAVRNRPSNGRVIFGDDAGSRGKGKGKYKGGATYQRDDRGDRDDDRDEARRTSDGSNVCVDQDRNGICDSVQQRSTTTTRTPVPAATTQKKPVLDPVTLSRMMKDAKARAGQQ